MESSKERYQARLDRDPAPVAVLHEGLYVYANKAYLQLFGYTDLCEIETVPLLDMLAENSRIRLRKHLKLIPATPARDPSPASVRLTMIHKDGTDLVTSCSTSRTVYDGEPCIVLRLRTHSLLPVQERVASLPWRLWLSIAFLAFMTLAPPALLLKLNINNAPKVYFPADEPAAIVDDKLRELFPSDQVFILLFEGVALFSDGFLTAYHQLAQELERDPLVDKVFGVTTQDKISGSEDGFQVDPLIDVRELDSTRAAQRLEYSTTDRFAKGTLAAEDGSALSMIIVPDALENSLQRLQLEKRILAAVQTARLEGYFTARTGFIPLDIAELRSMLRDNMIFIPATVAIGLFLVWWLFRHWLAVILTGITIGVVVGSSVALFVIVDMPFTLISSIVPPLLSALTIAALVHFYNALHYAAQRGMTGAARVDSALHEIRRPALFTSLTTAAGLMALTTSPIPAIMAFGLISAAGVILIYLSVIWILPPLFVRWDKKPWLHRRSGLRWMDFFVRRLYRIGIRYPLWVIILSVAGLAASLPALWDIKVETSLQEFFTTDHPVRRDTDYFQDKMTGTGSLDIILETPERDGLKNPAYLSFMRSFQTWVELLPEVDKTASPADFIEEMHWGFNAEEPELRRIPEDGQLISQYLFIYDGEDLYDFVDREFQTAHISLSINVHKANEINLLMKKIRFYLNERAPEGLQWEIGGYSRLFADMEDLLVSGQVYSLWGALLLIFFLMLFLWRSFRDAVLCMIPNISPVLLIFIIMGLTGMWLDMATAMIASVAVGIAVDDTIHVYHGFIKRIKAGIHPVHALARTFRQAGRAVTTTTIILSAQFLILAVSLFQPTAHFGLLTSIGLWAALLFDLLLLPAILVILADLKPEWYTQEKPLKSAV